MKARLSPVQTVVQLSRGGRGFFDREAMRALALQQRESADSETMDALLTLLAHEGDAETLDVPLRALPLTLDQVLVTTLPRPTGAATETKAGAFPSAPSPAQMAEWDRTQTLVRLGYALDVEGSPLRPETPYPDWRTARASEWAAYASALWAEMADAGLMTRDYNVLVEAMNRLNSRAVGELVRPKA